ncbi:MAG TPA: nucleoside transporter C-terminal domain-containing protein [Flavobacteriales bacterium]|nr:nucleoside transporter C-terminal domain-containing protein [Flavobacteriales bacterium]HRE95766.1 nucleoside transporter C-terminal domain-containing protein [Flavobacteriales bacterium]HRJ35598.1 nucleoside transporter C-terminal domain-containing protein [Flavobacteriales bacterium]HRJ38723.1 nucleoside transporter C-terminal domain-containing protein [Flavobacteriales bacterium]
MRRLTALLFSALLLASCSKPAETDPGKLLSRKWIDEKDTTQFLLFNVLPDGKQSVSGNVKGIQNEPLSGTWNLKGAELKLILVRSSETAIPLDSAVFYSGPAGSEVKFYNNNNPVTRMDASGSSDLLLERLFFIDTLSANQLVLHNDAGFAAEFEYTPQVYNPPFSLESLLRGLIGLMALVIITWVFSENRSKVNWRLVGIGLTLQIVFAIGVLKVPFVESMFEGISAFFIKVINFTQEGTDFLFRSFVSGKIESPLANFVVKVLPTVIFFSALTSLLFYWGILQKVVYGLAWVMRKTMRLSGAESLAAAGNIFLGQTEAPLLVKPYIGSMTRSELLCLMTGGMATIAGGVLAAYVGFLGGDDPEQQLYFAKHLLAASVMSAPAAIIAAKILLPETESFNTEMKIPRDRIGTNALEAITNGTSDGLRLAANVAAMLLVFIALIAMGNFVMEEIIGEYTGLNAIIRENTVYSGLSLQFFVGYIGSPIAWIMGVPSEDTILVGQLLGEKTILNEFYAYTSLGELKAAGKFHHEKSIVMATYVLCGFANFASIGIQIGGIGSLAPNRKSELSKLGFRALLGGTMACLLTAVVVGMFL